MLRLKAPGSERLLQGPSLEATFGGGEANVAVGLARFGMDAAFVSLIPPNRIGDACVAELRKQGVDTSHIVRKGKRLGIYFLEAGANQRPSVVIYDRAHSAIAEAVRGEIPWDGVFAGAGWFHIYRDHAGDLRIRRPALPGGGSPCEGERAECLLRPELPEESLEIRPDGAGGDDGNRETHGYGHGQRRGLPEGPGRLGRFGRRIRQGGSGSLPETHGQGARTVSGSSKDSGHLAGEPFGGLQRLVGGSEQPG